MAKLSWGEPTVKATKLNAAGVAEGSAITFPAIKQGTAQLNTEEGDLTEALDEGGDVVDSRRARSRYTFGCDVFAVKGESYPIAPNEEGKILDNYKLELEPEDSETVGFNINCCRVSCTEAWTSAEGTMLHYEFAAIKPKSGKTFELTNYAGA